MLTLSALVVTMIVSYLIPAVTALLTKASASAGLKQLVTAVLAAINGVVVTATQVDGTAVISKQALVLALGSFIAAQASYVALYKPHDANAKLSPTKGLGAILLLVIALSIAGGHASRAAAASTFTVDQSPAVGQVSTIDGTALCDAGACSYTTSVTYRTPGCCGRVVTITQLGRTAVVAWMPSAYDATHGYVTVVMVVGVPNPGNHLVRTTTYQQSFVVAT